MLIDGGQRLTTTRVAERAGVSVGTMYQYFPHKQALLYAVLERHLGRMADALEATCEALRGKPISIMAEGFVAAYVDAKTANAEASRALYRIAAELDATELVGGISKRIRKAVVALLASAPDAAFDDTPTVALDVRAAISCGVRSASERHATPRVWRAMREQLSLMCRAYLREACLLPPAGRATVATPGRLRSLAASCRARRVFDLTRATLRPVSGEPTRSAGEIR